MEDTDPDHVDYATSWALRNQRARRKAAHLMAARDYWRARALRAEEQLDKLKGKRP